MTKNSFVAEVTFKLFKILYEGLDQNVVGKIYLI